MKKARAARLFFTLIIPLVVIGQSFSAHAWVPRIQNNIAVSIEALETLRIILPADMPEDSLEWLALELDDVDVSALVQLEQSGDLLVVAVTPPEPLLPGQHELRLVEYNQQGEIIERGIWLLEVGQTADTGVQSQVQRFFSSALVLEGAYRIAEGDLDYLGQSIAMKKDHGQGTLSLQALSVNGEREISANANLIYDSHGALVGTIPSDDPTLADDPREGSDVEISDYLLSTRSPNLSALIGHHASQGNNLLMQDFYRRGISITGQSDSGAAVASGFAYRTEPVTGFRYGVSGVGDRKHRVAGTMLSVKPVAGNPEVLSLTATYLEGEGEDHSGFGLSGNNIRPEGEGSSVAIDSQLIDQRLQLRAERAETSYDFDGVKTDFNEEDDDATAYLGLFHIWRNNEVGGRYANWNIGYEEKEVGLFFRSLANPSLPFDRSLKRVFSALQVGGMSLQLQLAQEVDNVRGDDALPTLNRDLATMVLSWSPEARLDEEGNSTRAWYGHPSLNFSTQYSDETHVRVPSDMMDFAQDRQTVTYSAGASFQYESWYWQLNHSYGLDKDFTEFGSSIRQEVTDLGFQFQFSENFALGSQAQYESVLDRDSRNVNRRWLAMLDAQFSALDNRLNTSLNISVNRDEAKDDSIDGSLRTYGFRIDWLLREPRDNQPGWTLWLRGDRQETRDRLTASQDSDPYQVFIGARMDWPITLPRQY